jgi:hypothetical protein
LKLPKILTFIAMFLFAATGAILTSQDDTQAAKIATTVTRQGPIWLYTSDGTKITNRALSPNTEWAVGNTIYIHDSPLYQVATNEYIQYNYATLSDVQNPVQTPLIGTVTTRSHNGTITINENTGYISESPNLPEGSKWKIGKCIVNTFGEIYVEVARNTYVPAVHMVFNQILPEPTYNKWFFYQPLRDPEMNVSSYISVDDWFFY